MLHSILQIAHVLLAIAIVVLVLLQHGKGADAGAAFGGGASSTVFGARGSLSFMVKVTGIIAFLFFGTSLSLAYFANTAFQDNSSLVIPVLSKPTETISAPVAPVDTSVPAPAAKPTDVPATPVQKPADVSAVAPEKEQP